MWCLPSIELSHEWNVALMKITAPSSFDTWMNTSSYSLDDQCLWYYICSGVKPVSQFLEHFSSTAQMASLLSINRAADEFVIDEIFAGCLLNSQVSYMIIIFYEHYQIW